MANRVKIRRGTGKPDSTKLLPYELGWDTANKVLYIYDSNASDSIPIADGFLRATGIALESGDNIDSIGYGLFYSYGSTISSALSGTAPYTESGFRFFSFRNYQVQNNFQIAAGQNSIKIRFKNDSTWRAWQTILDSNTYSNYALPLTGGITTGASKFYTGTSVYREGNPLFMWQAGETSNYQNLGAIFIETNTVNSKRVCGKFWFRQYSYDSTSGATVSYWDQYQLPNVTVDKSSSSSYLILTSKDAVTIAQGGTGATSASGARSNLGAVNIAGDTMTGNLIIQTSGDTYVKAKNTTTESAIYLDSGGSSGNHGIYSDGYYNGTSFTSSGKMLIYRGNDGNIVVNGRSTHVDITDTTPTSATTYYLNFTSGKNASTQYLLRANSMIKAYITANGASAYIAIGDSSHDGALRLYSSGGKRLDLAVSTMSSSNRTATFADRDGTVILGDSGRKIFVVTTAGSTSVPSGAVNGDIVLVKA